MTTKTPGQIAYEADLAHEPNYSNGTARTPWKHLDGLARDSWERNPMPRHLRPRVETHPDRPMGH